MIISICRRFKFDAAHHLPYYEGKCKQIHGHRWWLDVEVSGRVQDQGPQRGMIMDFVDLKKVVNEVIIDVVDHTDLNLIFDNPTAENMIRMFASSLQAKINCMYSEYEFFSLIYLTRLRLYETEDSYAEWKADFVQGFATSRND